MITETRGAAAAGSMETPGERRVSTVSREKIQETSHRRASQLATITA